MVAWLLMVTLPSSPKMLPPKAHSQEVARAGGVLGGQAVGNQRFIQGLDIGHAGFKLLDGGGNGLPAGSSEQFRVIDHADGGHGPGQTELLAVDAAGGQRGFLEVLLEVILAQDLGPVGEHARLGHGVEDADVGLGNVELFSTLHADEQLLGGIGPGPAHPGDGVAGFSLIGVHHLLEDVLGGLFLAGPAGPDDVGALRHGRGRGQEHHRAKDQCKQLFHDCLLLDLSIAMPPGQRSYSGLGSTA